MVDSITVVLPVVPSSVAAQDSVVRYQPILGGQQPPAFDPHAAPRRMIIQTSSNTFKVALPFAPKEITYSNWGINWSQVNRDGRLPILVAESSQLPVLSFSATLGNSRNQDAPLTSVLGYMKAWTETTLPIKITYGGYFESRFLWRCTNFSIKSEERSPTTNEITKAEVDLEFTVVQDVVLSTGPVTGGVKPPTTSKPPKKKVVKKKPTKKKYKTYTVKKGDTLISIAIKLFKNASKWRYLADTNKIKNHKIKPGQKLKY